MRGGGKGDELVRKGRGAALEGGLDRLLGGEEVGGLADLGGIGAPFSVGRLRALATTAAVVVFVIVFVFSKGGEKRGRREKTGNDRKRERREKIEGKTGNERKRSGESELKIAPAFRWRSPPFLCLSSPSPSDALIASWSELSHSPDASQSSSAIASLNQGRKTQGRERGEIVGRERGREHSGFWLGRKRKWKKTEKKSTHPSAAAGSA